MKKIGVIGASGRLGKAICGHFSDNESLQLVPFTRADMDLSSSKSVRRGLTQFPFDILINCAALTDVDYCELNHEVADQINGTILKDIAWAADQCGALIIHISTDYVFEGNHKVPYTEADATHPLSYYGKSKLLGERCLLDHSDRHLVFRVSWLFGAEKPAFPEWILNKAMTTEAELPVVGNKWACPTLAENVAVLLEPCLVGDSVLGGIYHLCNRGVLSWSDYARLILNTATELGFSLKTKGIRDVPMESLDAFIAPRPVYSAMDTGKFESNFSLRPLSSQEAVRKHLTKILSEST